MFGRKKRIEKLRQEYGELWNRITKLEDKVSELQKQEDIKEFLFNGVGRIYKLEGLHWLNSINFYLYKGLCVTENFKPISTDRVEKKNFEFYFQGDWYIINTEDIKVNSNPNYRKVLSIELKENE